MTAPGPYDAIVTAVFAPVIDEVTAVLYGTALGVAGETARQAEQRYRTPLAALTDASVQLLAECRDAEPARQEQLLADLAEQVTAARTALTAPVAEDPVRPAGPVDVPANIAALVDAISKGFPAITYHPEDPNADAIAQAALQRGLVAMPDEKIQFRTIRGAQLPGPGMVARLFGAPPRG